MMQRIAIIGCGRIAPSHLDGLKLMPELGKVVAICDMDEKLRLERQNNYDIPDGFESVEALLNWGHFDIGAVLTPPDIRIEVCLPLIDANKHLMVEKPFNHSLREARLIVEAAEKAGIKLAVNQNFRWIPPAPRLRDIVLSGSLGRLLSIYLIHTVWRDESRGWRNTTDKLALSVMGVHWLDRIRWITGEEGANIYTASMNSGILTSVGEDITSTVITLKSGAVATLIHHWASHSREINNSLQIDGTEKSVVWKDGRLIYVEKDGKQTTIWESGKLIHVEKDGKQTAEPVQGGDMPQFMAASWTELIDAIEKDRQPHHSGKDNLWTVALLEGAYRSATEKALINIANL